jgi:uncharacterized protein (TIGR00730 family)
MAGIRTVCVYCGSSGAVAGRYRDAATELGTALAKAGIELVYGGGQRGLMGLLADAALAAGGRVTGIIPAAMREAEWAHNGVSELLVVDSMHTRKRLMAEKAEAFAVLPGGVGTLDETFEILSWRQLQLHDKPIFLVDIGGYWQPLRTLLEHLTDAGFARRLVPDLLRVADDIPGLMAALAEAAPGHRARAELL